MRHYLGEHVAAYEKLSSGSLCVYIVQILILEKVIETGKFLVTDIDDVHLINLRNLDIIALNIYCSI